MLMLMLMLAEIFNECEPLLFSSSTAVHFTTDMIPVNGDTCGCHDKWTCMQEATNPNDGFPSALDDPRIDRVATG